MPQHKKNILAIGALTLTLTLNACSPVQIFGAAQASYTSANNKCAPNSTKATDDATDGASKEPTDTATIENVNGTSSVAEALSNITVPEHLVPLFEQASKETGIPVSVVTAQIFQESGFKSDAVSWAGAKGIAQMMPETWAATYPEGDPTNDEDAMKAYAILMNELRGYVEHLADNDTDKLKLTLAAYNAGPGAVLKYNGIPPFPETQHYVENILGNQQIVFSEGAGNCQRSGGTAWDGDLGDGEWTNPCPGCTLTSGFGWRDLGPGYPDWMNNHVGVDMAGGTGDIISPTEITIVNIDPNFGCVVGQMPDTKLQLNFCHLDSWAVSVGDNLKRGDMIGIEGGRGPGGPNSFARHLHFEIFDPESPVPAWPYNGHNIDPLPILREKGAAPTE